MTQSTETTTGLDQESTTDTAVASTQDRDQESTTDTAVASTQDRGPLVTEQGTTVLSDTVVAKIAAMTAREVPGVHELGGNSATRAVSALRDRIPGTTTNTSTLGVSVEVGERQAAVKVDLVADYGYPLVALGDTLRRDVIAAVHEMTGLEVVAVDITVHDLHVPSDDADDDEGEAREVQ